MIGIVIAAHGQLAEALVNAALMVVTEPGPHTAIGISNHDDSALYEKRLCLAVAEVQSPEGVLILTDMFGGTPCNIGLTLHHPDKIEILTGLNLPMLVKALQLSKQSAPLKLLAKQVKDAGTRSITIASEVLGQMSFAENKK